MMTFSHEFVEFIPEKLDTNVLYVSLRFSLVSHLCACGCGEEVVTPIAPREWQLIFNGETISLFPSIGNWNFKCRSHYWIDQNRALFLPSIRRNNSKTDLNEKITDTEENYASVTDRLWSRLKRWRSGN